MRSVLAHDDGDAAQLFMARGEVGQLCGLPACTATHPQLTEASKIVYLTTTDRRSGTPHSAALYAQVRSPDRSRMTWPAPITGAAPVPATSPCTSPEYDGTLQSSSVRIPARSAGTVRPTARRPRHLDRRALRLVVGRHGRSPSAFRSPHPSPRYSATGRLTIGHPVRHNCWVFSLTTTDRPHPAKAWRCSSRPWTGATTSTTRSE